MKIVYDVKAGIYIKGDIQELANELISIEDKTPLKVLEYAKENQDSILYKNITWDDSVCADKYRITEVKNILNHIVIREVEEEEVNIRAFESIIIEEEDVDFSKRIYVNTIEAMDNADMRSKIIGGIKIMMTQAANKLDVYNNYISILLKNK